jgi:hypothetical protein
LLKLRIYQLALTGRSGLFTFVIIKPTNNNMYKTVLTTIIGAIVFQTGVFAQIYVKSTGVGIGISTPTTKLHLSGKMLIEGTGDDVLTFNNTSSILWQYMAFKRNGTRQAWMGLNNGNDFYLSKETSGNIVLNPSGGRVVIESTSPDNSVGGTLVLRHLAKGAGVSREWAIYNMWGGYGSSLQFWAYDNIGCAPGGMCFPALSLLDNGNVGIGIINPGYKLQVIGSARAVSFIADGNTWADYVFDSTYQLPSLRAVENYIKQNHHLPDVPSSEEVKKDGINLGDHQVTLLKKIEELTLYVIDQNKKLEEQNSTQKAQNERMALLERKLNEVLDENNKLKDELKIKKGL